jgi:hypothetical protein
VVVPCASELELAEHGAASLQCSRPVCHFKALGDGAVVLFVELDIKRRSVLVPDRDVAGGFVVKGDRDAGQSAPLAAGPLANPEPCDHLLVRLEEKCPSHPAFRVLEILHVLELAEMAMRRARRRAADHEVSGGSSVGNE